MPFRSKAQQRWMFANEPAHAKTWAKHTPDIKALPEHVGKKADGPGWDPNMAIFKPLPGQQPQQQQASPLTGQGGGFQGMAMQAPQAPAQGAPPPAPGTGSPLERYGPARRRPHLTDPLTMGGAMMDGAEGMKAAGAPSVREQWGNVMGGTKAQMKAAMQVGKGNSSRPAATAGKQELGLLKVAMGTVEAAWSKRAIADMSPAPSIAFTGQGAPPPAQTANPPVAAPMPAPAAPAATMGTAPHMANLAAMQGKASAPAPTVQPPNPITTPDGRTPGFTNPMPGAENPLGAGSLAYGGMRVPGLGKQAGKFDGFGRAIKGLFTRVEARPGSLGRFLGDPSEYLAAHPEYAQRVFSPGRTAATLGTAGAAGGLGYAATRGGQPSPTAQPSVSFKDSLTKAMQPGGPHQFMTGLPIEKALKARVAGDAAAAPVTSSVPAKSDLHNETFGANADVNPHAETGVGVFHRDFDRVYPSYVEYLANARKTLPPQTWKPEGFPVRGTPHVLANGAFNQKAFGMTPDDSIRQSLPRDPDFEPHTLVRPLPQNFGRPVDEFTRPHMPNNTPTTPTPHITGNKPEAPGLLSSVGTAIKDHPYAAGGLAAGAALGGYGLYRAMQPEKKQEKQAAGVGAVPGTGTPGGIPGTGVGASSTAGKGIANAAPSSPKLPSGAMSLSAAPQPQAAAPPAPAPQAPAPQPAYQRRPPTVPDTRLAQSRQIRPRAVSGGVTASPVEQGFGGVPSGGWPSSMKGRSAKEVYELAGGNRQASGPGSFYGDSGARAPAPPTTPAEMYPNSDSWHSKVPRPDAGASSQVANTVPTPKQMLAKPAVTPQATPVVAPAPQPAAPPMPNGPDAFAPTPKPAPAPQPPMPNGPDAFAPSPAPIFGPPSRPPASGMMPSRMFPAQAPTGTAPPAPAPGGGAASGLVPPLGGVGAFAPQSQPYKPKPAAPEPPKPSSLSGLSARMRNSPGEVVEPDAQPSRRTPSTPLPAFQMPAMPQMPAWNASTSMQPQPRSFANQMRNSPGEVAMGDGEVPGSRVADQKRKADLAKKLETPFQMPEMPQWGQYTPTAASAFGKAGNDSLCNTGGPAPIAFSAHLPAGNPMSAVAPKPAMSGLAAAPPAPVRHPVMATSPMALSAGTPVPAMGKVAEDQGDSSQGAVRPKRKPRMPRKDSLERMPRMPHLMRRESMSRPPRKPRVSWASLLGEHVGAPEVTGNEKDAASCCVTPVKKTPGKATYNGREIRVQHGTQTHQNGKFSTMGRQKKADDYRWSWSQDTPGGERSVNTEQAGDLLTHRINDQAAHNPLGGMPQSALIGGVLGGVMAPKGEGFTGAGRGAVAGMGTMLGSGLGSVVGTNLGNAIGHSGAAAGLGGLAGLGLGAVGGHYLANHIMGRPRWEEKSAYDTSSTGRALAMGIAGLGLASVPVGAMTAPSGHRGEGARRAMTRGRMIGTGSLGGGLGGAFLGQGLASMAGSDNPIAPLIGGTAGALAGGYGANKLTDWMLGPPSWRDSENHKEHEREDDSPAVHEPDEPTPAGPTKLGAARPALRTAPPSMGKPVKPIDVPPPSLGNRYSAASQPKGYMDGASSVAAYGHQSLPQSTSRDPIAGFKGGRPLS